MSFPITFASAFDGAIYDQIDYLRSQLVPDHVIDPWIDQVYDAAASLTDSPMRCSVAKQESLQVGFEVRKLVFQHYLIFYRVNESERLVEILYFRHGAREPGSGFD